MKNLLNRFIKTCPKTGRFLGFKSLKGLSGLLFPLIGLSALIWIIIRVIPKPSRVQYPCIKAAAPIAAGFITYIIGLASAVFFYKTGKYYFLKSKYLPASILLFLSTAAGLFTFLKTGNESYASIKYTDSLFIPVEPPNTPMGTGKGIFPGRVVWMWDSSAANWDGENGNWWDDQSTNQEKVDSMLSKSLRSLSAAGSDLEAWDAIFKYFNEKHDKGNLGYQPGEKIAIKINLNQISTWNYSHPGNASFPSPQAVLAIIRQLVINAGVTDQDITIYDSNRLVPDAIYNKVKNEFPGVHFMGWQKTAGREKYLRDTTIVHWSEDLIMEINGGNPAYLPSAVTHADYLINVANFKGHRYMGVTFCSKNHFGTISCDDINGTPFPNAPHAAGLHYYTAVHNIIIPGSEEWTFYGRPMGTYNTLVDLMGHKDIGQKTLLFMIDALYAVQSEQDAVSPESKWLSEPFNNDWTSSLFISQDNVAIESVGLDFFRTEAAVNPNDTTVYGVVDNYLHEAAMADNPPSGTYYDPDNDGSRLESLGIHEHWNNAVEKSYVGIDLVCLQNTFTSVDECINPNKFILFQNYPNPFNPSTKISFYLPSRLSVSLKIYDLNGKEVKTIINEELSEGVHSRQWNAERLSSGVYFCQLKAGKFINIKKLLLLK
jgi:hypothetical protein